MAKDNKKDPEPKNEEKTIVLFGGQAQILPSELEELGLAGQAGVREIPGVAPSWKPAGHGDYLLGRCVDIRSHEFDIGTTKQRTGIVGIFETAVPGGFRSVWLGADLRVKLSDPIGKVYQIYYEGETRPNRSSQSLNPMKTYRVLEIVPINKVPETIDIPK
jgi:hypothetical protein